MSNYTILADGGSRDHADKKIGYGSWKIFANDGTKRVRHEQDEFGLGITNNVAEYMSAISGVQMLVAIIEGAGMDTSSYSVELKTDSQLLEKQVKKEWACKDKKLLPLRDELTNLLDKFSSWSIVKVPREVMVANLGH